MAFRASPRHSPSKLGSALDLRLNSYFMAFRASPRHSPSKLGSALDLRLNSDLSSCYTFYTVAALAVHGLLTHE